MSAYSKTSLATLRFVQANPDRSVTEIGERIGNRRAPQYVSGLVKGGLLVISGREKRPMINGVAKIMNLHAITDRGVALLCQIDEAEKRTEKVVEPKVYTPLPETPVVKAARRPDYPDVVCSVAAKREPSTGYVQYKAPEQTGRGYVPRPIRNVANM